MEPEAVNVDNFVRAESNRMFAALARDAGGVGRWVHYREVAPVDHQNIIRQNRDTLYSAAIVDITAGATVVLPDIGERYQSVMVLNQDHHIERVIHEAGEHELAVEQFRTPFVLLGARTLVDPNDPNDVQEVHRVQDQLDIRASSNRPFVCPDYDETSLDATRSALLELARGVDGFSRMFGARSEVDPVRHLIGAAAGWGGLPEHEAFYLNIEPRLPVGEYRITVRDVPVDAFWSLSIYNAEGYFERNDRGVNSINNLTAVPDADGAITIRFGSIGPDAPGGDVANYLTIMDGWNYMVRLYRPRPEILDRTWTFPGIEQRIGDPGAE